MGMVPNIIDSQARWESIAAPTYIIRLMFVKGGMSVDVGVDVGMDVGVDVWAWILKMEKNKTNRGKIEFCFFNIIKKRKSIIFLHPWPPCFTSHILDGLHIFLSKSIF